MTKDEQIKAVEYMEDQISELESTFRRAKVAMRVEARGAVPTTGVTALQRIDEAIEQCNVVINLVPRELKLVKLSMVEVWERQTND